MDSLSHQSKIKRDAYLLWIKNQRGYADGYIGCDYVCNTNDVTYYEVMKEIIYNPSCSDALVDIMRKRDEDYMNAIRSLSKPSNFTADVKKFFITITTDKSRNVTHRDMMDFMLFMRDKCKWVVDFRGSIENHKENGELLHCHFIIQPDDTILYGSKVKDKLWSMRICNKMIGGSNYIEYRSYMEVHEDYIRGNKQASKLPLVEKDRQWREDKGIPHLFSKN